MTSFPSVSGWCIRPRHDALSLQFNSIDFLVFLVAVLLVVRLANLRWRNWILLAASIVFYGWWDWRYLGLLGTSCGLAYCGALAVDRATTPQARRWRCVATVASCAALLVYFKYRGFFLENLAGLSAALGWPLATPSLAVVLPVGISFYTFQAMAYVIDVYRGTTPACRNLRDFLLFKTFFPQLVAGPIERAQHLLPQIQEPRRPTKAEIIEGCYLFLWGFAKKVVVADNLALKVNRLFDQSSFSTADVIVGSLGFAFQIYADFSGYTDIARGVARWLGIHLMDNFRFPYFASNPRDFWQRWHISLSSWLRTYIYIPLGGNRRGRGRTAAHLLVTMLIGGLWHGAAWNFVLWGAYQGLLLIGYQAVAPKRAATPPRPAGKILGVAVMFTLTLYGWLLFRLNSFGQIAAATRALGTGEFGTDFLFRLTKLLPYVGLILVVDGAVYFSGNPWFFVRQRPLWTALFFLLLFYAILILAVARGDRFIYFAF